MESFKSVFAEGHRRDRITQSIGRQPDRKEVLIHEKENNQPIHQTTNEPRESSMIREALFHQPWITGEEPDDPQIEINECVTSQIKDMPKEIQDRINSLNGSRRAENKKFKLGSKSNGQTTVEISNG